MRKLKEGDYVLTDGAAWFSVNGFAVLLRETTDGMNVSVYQDGNEMANPLCDYEFFRSDLTDTEEADA